MSSCRKVVDSLTFRFIRRTNRSSATKSSSAKRAAACGRNPCLQGLPDLEDILQAGSVNGQRNRQIIGHRAGIKFAHEASFALVRVDHSDCFQGLKPFPDRGATDPEIIGQLAFRRQFMARFQLVAENEIAELMLNHLRSAGSDNGRQG